MKAKPKIAILGASGIGRHHGNWWTVEGADVCAFLGRSAESVAATTETLQNLFGFAGRGYTDLDDLLGTEKPDIVDVCTSTECHYEHAKKALQAGCDVLCEKPFVYDESLPHETIRAQADELLALARKNNVMLGVSIQYSISITDCYRLYRQLSDAPITRYRGHLASPHRGRPPHPPRTWVDLSPHLLSALSVIAPDGELDPASLQTNFEEYAARATFEMKRPGQPGIHCEIDTNRTLAEPRNIRHFEINDVSFDIEGRRDEEGHFAVEIRYANGKTHLADDAMRLLIRDFLSGKLRVSGDQARNNLEKMLNILHAAKKQ